MKRPPEMSRRQFADALKRNNFTGPILFWFQDQSGQTERTSYSGVFNLKGKLMRRATIASLIHQRDIQIAKQSKLSPEDDAVLFATGHLPEDF